MVFAGPATVKISDLEFLRFVVFAGPAMVEILELQFHMPLRLKLDSRLRTSSISGLWCTPVFRVISFTWQETVFLTKSCCSWLHSCWELCGLVGNRLPHQVYLELQFVRLVVIAGPATDKILGWNFGTPDCKAVVSAGRATGKILKVQIIRFMVFAGPATDKILEPSLEGLKSFLHLPRMKFWSFRF